MIDILKVAYGSQCTSEIVKELQTWEDMFKWKTYRTYLNLPEGGEHCTLLTTSKDIHLVLGRLSYKSHQNLAWIIIRALYIEGAATGLFLVPGDNGAYIATVSHINDEYTIHLSEAR